MAASFENKYIDSAQGTSTGHAGTIGDPYSLQDFVNEYANDHALLSSGTHLLYHITGSFNHTTDIGTDTVNTTALDVTQDKTINIQAFGSTPGDGGLSIHSGCWSLGIGYRLEGIDATASKSNFAVLACDNTGASFFYRCKAHNTRTGTSSYDLAFRPHKSPMYYCKAVNDGQVGAAVDYNYSRIENCLLINKGDKGVRTPGNNTGQVRNCDIINAAATRPTGCIAVEQGGNSGAQRFIGNRLYNWDKGFVNYFNSGTQFSDWIYNNNIFDDVDLCFETPSGATYGQRIMSVMRNYYYNATNFHTEDFAFERDNEALTASPFTDPANNDLSLNNDAGGGAVCRAAGLHIQSLYDWDNMVPIATAYQPQPIASDLGFGY